MDSAPAIYLGRIVKKENFRTNVYAPNGTKKLVESWDAFEAAMGSGLWFATVEDAKASVVEIVPEPQKKPKKSSKKETAVEILEESENGADEEVIPSEDLAFEVTPEDDFLPKAS